MSLSEKTEHWPSRLKPADRAKAVQDTRDEWRRLGFWYDYDQKSKVWLLRADKSGITKLADLFYRFSANPRNENKGEHDHYGPYSYFTVTAWCEPMVAERGFFGLKTDFKRLSEELQKLIPASLPSKNQIAHSFRSEDGTKVFLNIENSPFDPASADLSIVNEP